MNLTKEKGLLVHAVMMAGRSNLWVAGLVVPMVWSVSAYVQAAAPPAARDRGFTAAAGYRTTRLGLHVTQEELDIWRQRAVRGPYKSTGDASANSPGDWDRIKANADQFLRNPSAERWTGLTTAFKPSMHVAPEDRRYGSKLRDAGFACLITGHTRYREAVRSELLAQAAEPGVDFTNRSLWVMSFTGDGNPSFDIVNWLTRLLFGYDYIRSSISASDRRTLDTWFRNAALYWEHCFSAIVEARFPNRYQEDYTINGTYVPMPEVQCSYTHYNGWKACDWHEAWNNRGCCQVRFVALTGILVDDPFLKARTKRYFKEWLTYAVFPDGVDQEYKRWTDYRNTTSHGWSYASVKIGSLVTIADAFARTGDFELYEFSTSDGVYGTKGGPKSLGKVLTVHTSFVDNTIKYYATDKASNVGDPRYLIDTEEEFTGTKRNGDIYAAPMANIYFQDPFLKDRYSRAAPGAPPYPADPSTGGWDAWTGEWGVYPGVLFMFGQMEGKVWPYPRESRRCQKR